MLDDLWAGQCNDAYWHGVFGGLYLPHLRDALYRHLILADEAADAVIADAEGKGDDYLQVEEGDLDGDLAREVMVSNRLCAVLVDPAEGGTIYEFDYRPVSMNFMNTLSRREEAYHKKIAEAVGACEDKGCATTIHERVVAKEEGLSEHLQYDWYRRSSLVDHFLGGEADFDSFRNSGYHDAGDFVLGGYAHKTRKKDDSVKLALTRSGSVAGQPLKVEKVITVKAGEAGFEAAYTLTNEGPDELNATFGTEFNLSLLAGDSPDRYYDIKGHVLKSRNFASAGELNNVTVVRMVDEWLGYSLSIGFSEVAVLWRFPVDTVSQSEAGFERVYQGSSVMPLWRISLKPGGKWNVVIRFALDRRP
jgi:alpha-amylase